MKVDFFLKWVWICQIVIILSSSFAGASGETSIPHQVSSVELIVGESGYKFRLDALGGRKLGSVVVIWNDLSNTLKEADFGEVDEVLLDKIAIKALTPMAKGRQERVVLLIPYRERSLMRNGEISYSSDVIRLLFDKNKLIMWERSEAVDDSLGRWALSFCYAGKEVVKNGIVDSPGNPYAEKKAD